MEEKLIELEMILTHQQQMIDELNEIVIAQGKDINDLKRKTILLKETMDSSLLKNEEDETPPPHY